MTGPEHNELAILNARLFGLDGSGEEGAIGRIERRMDRMERLVNKAIGALAITGIVIGFLQLDGLRAVITAIVNSAPQ